MNTPGAGSGHDDADIIGWLGVAAATDSLASCPAPGALTPLEAFGLFFFGKNPVKNQAKSEKNKRGTAAEFRAEFY